MNKSLTASGLDNAHESVNLSVVTDTEYFYKITGKILFLLQNNVPIRVSILCLAAFVANSS